MNTFALRRWSQTAQSPFTNRAVSRRAYSTAPYPQGKGRGEGELSFYADEHVNDAAADTDDDGNDTDADNAADDDAAADDSQSQSYICYSLGKVLAVFIGSFSTVPLSFLITIVDAGRLFQMMKRLFPS